MRTTKHNLMEQLRITKRVIDRRKDYLGFTEQDVKRLASLKQVIVDNLEDIVEKFYDQILPFDEMDMVIGDSETLLRLKNHQYQYISSLFDGQYDEEYVHSRLRVGVVHKRIGLDPKYYVAAVHNLSSILRGLVADKKKCSNCMDNLSSIEKILMFDLSLTFDTYINGLMDEAESSRLELERYAASLEETVAKRTQLLKEQATHDGLTGLLNQHTFYAELRKELSRAKRMNYSIVLVYFDLDGFKKLNDSKGHKAGDTVLVSVADSMKKITRENEIAARYGGDEFCIILIAADINAGEIVAKRLCDEIKKSTKGTGITCSIGLAISTADESLDADRLVRLADKAMYEAKKEDGFATKISDQKLLNSKISKNKA